MNLNEKRKIKKTLKMKKCRYCKEKPPQVKLTIDHKIPKSKGGTDDIKNLQCLCEECNMVKSGLSHKDLIRILEWYHKKILNKGRVLSKKFNN